MQQENKVEMLINSKSYFSIVITFAIILQTTAWAMNQQESMSLCPLNSTENICNQHCQINGEIAICIPKCCGPDQVLDSNEFVCSDSGDKKWTPTIYVDSDSNKKLSTQPRVHVYISPLLSERRDENEHPILFTLKGYGHHPKADFRLLRDGTAVLKTPPHGSWERFPEGKFCVDGAQNFTGESESFTGLEMDTVIILYAKDETNLDPPPHRFLYAGALLTSAVCLGITIIVHGVILENRDAFHWALMAYFISFFCMQIFLAAAHLLPHFTEESIRSRESVAHKFCVVIGVAAHLFYLLTFSWLSIISFTIWETLRHIDTLRQKKKHGIMRFGAYVIFTLAVTIPIVLTAVCLDNLYGGDEIESTVVVPGFGESCFVEMTLAALFYLYLPVGVLLLFNTSLFIMTTYHICVAKNSKKAIVDSGSNQRDRKTLFVRLYFVMGIPFLFELVSWIFTKDNVIIPWYFVILDLFIILQGIAILYLFCLSGTSRTTLMKKFPMLKRFADFVVSKTTSLTSFELKSSVDPRNDTSKN